ncbi:MAG: hypothetical protein F4Z85_00425 [Gemmatimonadetes bacterium]|nr:hypothetical protein [Gemmatimonadota bacterium]MYB71359.1 hypothetical protein [Gemmatimonadota bacterium]
MKSYYSLRYPRKFTVDSLLPDMYIDLGLILAEQWIARAPRDVPVRQAAQKNHPARSGRSLPKTRLASSARV